MVGQHVEDPVSGGLGESPVFVAESVHRFALNYKKVPYTTVWVQYGDIQTVSKEIGATTADKRPTGEPRYTLPAIRIPATGEVIADSAKIIAYLEEKYPERPLIPAGTLEQQLAFSDQVFGAIGPVSTYPQHTTVQPSGRSSCQPQDMLGFVGGIGYSLMSPSSGAAFERLVRSIDNGPPFAERPPPPPEAWTRVQEGFSRLAQLCGTHKYAFGDHITYADFLAASMLYMLYASVSDERKAEIRKWDGGKWGALTDEFEAAGYTATDRGEVYVAHA
jgi:glutathione S-transferase